MRAPYYLYKRGKVYYCQIGAKRLSVAKLQEAIAPELRGIKPTSKAAAAKIVETYIAKFGSFGSGDSAAEYLSTFWTDNSTYIKGLRERGRNVSAAYIRDNAAAIRRFVLFLESLRIGEINEIEPRHIEAFILQVKESGASGRRCNGILQSIAVPLNYYWSSKGSPALSPARQIKKFPEKPKGRTLWTPDEVRALFADPSVWLNTRVMHANLLAAISGMRRGEISGLLIDDLNEDSIHVRHNWQGGKLVQPKWGSERLIPVPRKMIARLVEQYDQNPWANGYVFWGPHRNRPLGGREFLNGLVMAMEKAGISKAEAQQRGLNFHAWRHWYNTMLRGRLQDHELRALTGHSSEKMTERYTHVTTTQLQATAFLAEQVGIE